MISPLKKAKLHTQNARKATKLRQIDVAPAGRFSRNRESCEYRQSQCAQSDQNITKTPKTLTSVCVGLCSPNKM